MAKRRFAGRSEVPPGVYFQSWREHPHFVLRGEGLLPGPPERSFFRLSPLAVSLLAPIFGVFFIAGFFLLTLAAVALMPFALLRRRLGRTKKGPTALGIAAAAAFLGTSWLYAQAIPNEACFGCHRRGLEMRLGDGTKVSLQVLPDAYDKSVHGQRLMCTACHQGIKKLPHRRHSFPDRRALTLNYSRACTICHSGKFKEFQESVHRRFLLAGNRNAPLCADCHGAHTVTEGGVGRVQISRSCAKCHAEISRNYEKSVHGKALSGEGNPDVPTCSTCHLSHIIKDPRKIGFRIDIPKLCADCHQNGSLMKKYGLSTQVVSTYLHDFHGVSLQLYGRQPDESTRLTAVCTDCHGIHDIRSHHDPESRVANPNLLRTCQRCHPGAPPSFPAAWLSHHIPSPESAPLVYYVGLFYIIFLPGMVIVVLVHVCLDLTHGIKTRRASRKREEL